MITERARLLLFALLAQASLVLARKMKWRLHWYILNCYFELAEERQQLKLENRMLRAKLAAPLSAEELAELERSYC